MIRLKVREIAETKGFTQGRLSRAADIDENTLRKIYKDPTGAVITTVTLDKIATALGVDVRDLLESVPSAPLHSW